MHPHFHPNRSGPGERIRSDGAGCRRRVVDRVSEFGYPASLIEALASRKIGPCQISPIDRSFNTALNLHAF